MAAPFNSSYTFPQHRISVTDNLRAGNAASSANQLLGVPVSTKQFEALGAVATAAANGILTATAIAGATPTLAPNATPTNGSLVSGVATVDFPRTLVIASSNAGDTTQTVTLSGLDYYGAPMTQQLPLNGTTPVKTLKAFYSVNNIAVSAALAGNLTVGTGTALGLSYKLLLGSIPVGSKVNGATTAVTADTLAGSTGITYPDVTNPATSTTGDVRGTVDPTQAPNGTFLFFVEYQTAGGPTSSAAYGQTQA